MTLPAPDLPLPFGYKCTWLTVRSEDALEVANQLGLEGQFFASWWEGIEAAYDFTSGWVFVTPPIKGWVLVVSKHLPHVRTATDAPERLSPLLMRLGQHFEEVQYFGTHRTSDWHAWAKVYEGRLVRRYSAIGPEVMWDEGKPTAAEKLLRLEVRAPFEEDKYPTERMVMHVAEQWSVNPTRLDELNLPPSLGILGKRIEW